jgi:hypothetical protein
MATRTIREGNVTTQILDLTNGIGGKSAEVRRITNEMHLTLALTEKSKSFCFCRTELLDSKSNTNILLHIIKPFQDILALTNGGSVREYTEIREVT